MEFYLSSVWLDGGIIRSETVGLQRHGTQSSHRYGESIMHSPGNKHRLIVNLGGASFR